MFVFALSLVAPALACDGKPCDAASCQMPATSTETAAIPAGATVAKLKVTGMSCGACADKVKAALSGVSGVTVANVDATAGTAEVGYDAGKTKVDAIIAAVNATGHFTASAM